MTPKELNEMKQSKMSKSTETLFEDVEVVEKEKEYFLDDSLEMIGFGRTQIEILFVFGVLLMMVVNETMGMSIISIASQCDFNTNSQEKALMGTACVTGILLASYFMGYLSDTYGRRTVLFRATIAAIIFSTISMFVSSLWVFICLRFLTGIGVAGASATIYAYLGEFNTPKYRPVMINYASVFVGISTIYTPGFGKVQLEILLFSGVLLMLVINETMGMSILTIASQCDFNTTSQEKAIMSAACFTGILIASFGWGYLSDSSGRRSVLLRATMSAVAFSFMSIFVSNFWLFVLLRFLTGIGIAGASATTYAYLGEFNTMKYRAVVINYASIFVGLSIVYSPGFGRVHFEILIACAIVVLDIVNETIASSIVVLASQCDFDSSPQERGIMNTSVFIGLLLAAYPWGHFADIFGRRIVLLCTSIASVLFSLASMFAWNKWIYVIFRFLTGIAIAGSTSTVYPYLSEFNAMKYRPAVINYVTIPLGVSLVFSGGFGRVHFEILFVCALVVLGIINETIASSLVVLSSQCDFGTTPLDRAIMNTSVFAGLIVASYPWGHLADIFGRRTVLLCTTTASTIFSFISMFALNKWFYVLFRFFTGLAVAGSTSTIYPFLGEFNANKYRPAVINYVTIPLGLSLIFSSVIAWLILPQTWSFSFFGIFDFRPWRLLILFNLLPGLIGSIWIWTLPETPKLYLSHGKDADALKVLYWIYERNTGKPSKDFEVKRLIPEADEAFIQTIQTKKTTWEIASSMWKQTVPLFKPPHALNYCVCCFVMFGLFFSSSGMGLWYPEIQNRLGFGTVNSHKTICGVINDKPNVTINDAMEHVCSDEISTKTYIDSITLGGSYVVAYLLLGIIINPLGRKAVLAGALGISGACGLSLQWVDEPTAIVILFCGYLMLSGLCVSVLSGSVVDLIPTHLRGKAVCICLMIGRLGSVVGNNIIGAALETYCEVTFYIFSGLIIFCSLLTLVLPI